MPNLLRGLSMVLTCLMVLVIFGCAEDNEAFVKAQAEANALTDKTGPTPGERPRNPQEYFKQQQERQSNMFSKGSGYPVPRKK